ncbi:unnamed protein product [Spodoptera exigua]|nr:unnamed protein product [Spodoptera exigua]
MTTPKRERSINFSPEEVELLISLVVQNKTIVENKKSDAVTWNEKEQCWKTIEEIFNSTSGTHFRSAKTLKAKYEGIKRITRQKSALICAESYRTVGGPSTAVPLTSIEEKVKNMILLPVDGIESELEFVPEHVVEDHILTHNKPLQNDDSDKELSSRKKGIEDRPIQNDDPDKEWSSRKKLSQHTIPKRVSNDQKWSNWKPKFVHSKKHPALAVEKMKRPFERVTDSKLEIAELQKKILEEELLNKRKQWAFEEEEREHKREMWALEKKYFLNKFDK